MIYFARFTSLYLFIPTIGIFTPLFAEICHEVDDRANAQELLALLVQNTFMVRTALQSDEARLAGRENILTRYEYRFARHEDTSAKREARLSRREVRLAKRINQRTKKRLLRITEAFHRFENLDGEKKSRLISDAQRMDLIQTLMDTTDMPLKQAYSLVYRITERPNLFVRYWRKTTIAVLKKADFFTVPLLKQGFAPIVARCVALTSAFLFATPFSFTTLASGFGIIGPWGLTPGLGQLQAVLLYSSFLYGVKGINAARAAIGQFTGSQAKHEKQKSQWPFKEDLPPSLNPEEKAIWISGFMKKEWSVDRQLAFPVILTLLATSNKKGLVLLPNQAKKIIESLGEEEIQDILLGIKVDFNTD